MPAPERIVSIGAARLSIDDIDAIARGARVELAGSATDRLQRSYEFMRSVVERNLPVYGLTTGCGPLAGNRIDPQQRQHFQRNLIRSHAVTLGEPHPPAFVRAAMAVRAHVFAHGYSGVDPACVTTLLGMLNHDLHPIVRGIGGVGASGDLIELAQIALAVIGEGLVQVGDKLLPAKAALRRAGLSELAPQFREGLALINGTSFHTGSAAVLWKRAQRILAAAQVAAAMAFDALHGHIEALDPALHAARGFTAQQTSAAQLRGLLKGSQLTRQREPVAGVQDAYTLRCIPQVHGAVADNLDRVATVIDTELNAISDNPLFLADEDRVVHGGNFHGQPLSMALDQLKLAVVELGVIGERRLARLLDSTLNGGLPGFLVPDGAGASSGFMGLQYCATTMAAENIILAAPASVTSIPTNANNQDVVSMAMLAVRHATRVLDNVERMVAIELLCAAQALELRGAERAATGTGAALRLLRQHAAFLKEDRPLADDVEQIRQLIENGSLATLTTMA